MIFIPSLPSFAGAPRHNCATVASHGTTVVGPGRDHCNLRSTPCNVRRDYRSAIGTYGQPHKGGWDSGPLGACEGRVSPFVALGVRFPRSYPMQLSAGQRLPAEGAAHQQAWLSGGGFRNLIFCAATPCTCQPVEEVAGDGRCTGGRVRA